MVYKAHDRTLDETVAIKILRPDFAEDPKMAQRFKSEIKLARKVRHKNVCAIHDFGDEKGLLFISMEYIDGVDLKRVIKQQGSLQPDQAYDVSIQVAEGLRAVHEAGIIHRDLKTLNIMLDARGLARLMDFGVAKQEGGEGMATASGHVLGTPDYMSPEQAQGRKVDSRCDIYALGIVMYELFSGHVPFRGDTPISTILKHIHDPPPLDGPEAAGIPYELRPILGKALAKEPADRYQTVGEMAAALQQARTLRDRSRLAITQTEAPTLTTVRAFPESAAASSPPARSRALRPALVAFAFVAAGTLALLGGTALVLRRTSSQTAEPTPNLAASAPPSLAQPLPEAPSTSPEPTATPTAPDIPPPKTPSRVVSRDADKKTQPAAAVAPDPSPQEAATPAPSVPAPVAPAPAATAAPKEEGPGLLQVAVRPWGNVFVDGKLIGTWPIDRIPLNAGEHRVRFEHPAYEPFESAIRINAGETSKLSFDFAKDGTRKR